MRNQILSDTAIAAIVSGFAGRSDVSIEDIITLVTRLKAMGPEAVTAEQSAASTLRLRQAPAVHVDRSVTQDTIFCMCCGKGFKMLKRHIGAEHGLTEAEYRTMFDLPADAPLVAPSYSKRKAEYAKRSGLGKHSRDASVKNAEIS